MYVCASGGQKRVLEPLKPELQAVESHRCGHWDQTRVLWRSSELPANPSLAHSLSVHLYLIMTWSKPGALLVPMAPWLSWLTDLSGVQGL